MRAVVWTEYGGPSGLRLEEAPTPVPRAGELLIRVRATTVTAGDCELRALRFGFGMRLLIRLMMGLLRPRRKVLGQEFAGDVEAVGAEGGRFHVGEPVYGTTGFGFGAYAEYLCLRESAGDAALALKPANLSYEEAATIPTGGLEALHFLRRAGHLRGKTVLVVGAGGGIGTLAVQLAKYLGAEVTGVDAARKLDLVRSLGADRLVDYAREDCTAPAGEYDVVFDAVGRGQFSARLRAVRRGGCYLLANPSFLAMIRAPWAGLTHGKTVVVRGPRPETEELDYLRRLIEAGKLRPTIDRGFRLEEVPEAHRRVDSGMSLGRVTITV